MYTVHTCIKCMGCPELNKGTYGVIFMAKFLSLVGIYNYKIDQYNQGHVIKSKVEITYTYMYHEDIDTPFEGKNVIRWSYLVSTTYTY